MAINGVEPDQGVEIQCLDLDDVYFVAPYLGARSWIAVRLDAGAAIACSGEANRRQLSKGSAAASGSVDLNRWSRGSGLPCIRRFLVRSAKTPSIMFNHDGLVGTKCRWKRR